MIRVIMNGACGRMGREIVKMLESEKYGCTLAAAVDMNGGDGIYKSLSEVTCEADVLIDFSNHAAIQGVMEFACQRKLPAVVATTGFTDEEADALFAAAKVIPVFISANMSLGIALLVSFAKQASALLSDADIEIVEVHHNQKLDSPSGTAMMLAEAIKQVRPEAEFVYGRSGHGKRTPNEVGIHALRMGNVIGEHEVILSTGTQTIKLKHEAHDRLLFAEGAMSAVSFIYGKSAGVYGMKDMIGAE